MSTLVAIETLPAGTWQVDPVHSQVGFAVAYSGGTFRGTFAPVEEAARRQEVARVIEVLGQQVDGAAVRQRDGFAGRDVVREDDPLRAARPAAAVVRVLQQHRPIALHR